MNNITYAVSVDVNNPIIPYNVYVANVLDSNVRYLEITLYQNGNVIALSNEATATASLVTDNVLVDDSVECTISNNIISVPLEDLQRHGNLDVQVTVTEGTKILAIPFPIQVRVTPNIVENAQIDENSLGSYAEVVHEIAEARGTYTTLHDAIATKLDNAANAVKTMHITDGAVTEEKLSFQTREKLNSIDSESVREATAQYLATHPALSASLRFVTPEMYTAGTDAEKITAAINSGLPVLLTGTYNVGDFTISRPCQIFGEKPDNKNVYNLTGNITFESPAVLSDLTILGSVTFDRVTSETVSTLISPTIVTNVSVRGNDAYPTHNGFAIKSSEGRFTNCVASNALHGFSVENIANRLINCTSYFNMLDGFHVNQGTNMLLACKSFLNARYNRYWLTHGGYTESNPRTDYFGYYFGGKDIQCVGCSSQQNHRGSVYIGTDALITDINILGDNTDYYDQDSTYGADIRNESMNSAAFTFGPGIAGAKLAPRISGKVSLYRDGGDWSAYTPIVFKKLGSKSNIYIDANIYVPELAPDFNDEVSPTVLGPGMEGIENIVINGNALFNSLHGFSISKQDTNALYSYDGNVLRTSNKSLVRNFTSTDCMSCKQVTVAVDFRSDLESSYCNVGVKLSDDTVMPGIYQNNTNQYSDVHTFIAPERKTITGITIQGARHPDTDNWDEFWDYYRIKVSFEA